MEKQSIKKKAIKYLKANYNSSFSDDIGTNGIGDDIIDAYVAGFEACEGKADSTSEKDLRVCSVNGSVLFQSMGEFAYKAFPDATSIEHLKKLKIEADEAIEEPKNIFEYSDCLLALFGAAHKAGFSYDQLLEASQSKFEIVKTRNWEKLSDGTYQHCH